MMLLDKEPYAHPKVVSFHLGFKAAALGFYIFGGIFTSSFIIHFVVCVLLLAFDFWVVKNVSGRILVGLRWWNETDEGGDNRWRFESLSKEDLERLSKKDVYLFWWTLYLTPALWLLLAIAAAIKFSFDYLLIVAVALTLGGANIVGFTKCRSDAKKQIQQFAANAVSSHLASTLESAMGV